MHTCLLATLAALQLAAFARAQAGTAVDITPNETAHCTWDGKCDTPIIRGGAEVCHSDQLMCEGSCSDGDYNATWCDGEPLFPELEASAACTWHDRDDLMMMEDCATLGDNATVEACQSDLAADMHPACWECLFVTAFNASYCLLDAQPSCVVHDAHDVFEMWGCGVLHPNATTEALSDCYAGVLMDMSPGCSDCLEATDYSNVSYCMLEFQVTKCSPCDVNWLRHQNECEAAGLGDICSVNDFLHLSDHCAACLVMHDSDWATCMPEPAPGQCLIEDSAAFSAVQACGNDDGTPAYQACVREPAAGLSDVSFSFIASCRPLRRSRPHADRHSQRDC